MEVWTGYIILGLFRGVILKERGILEWMRTIYTVSKN